MLTKIPGKIAMVSAVLLLAAAALAEDAGHPASEAAQPGLLDPDVTSIVWVLVIFIVMATILY
ncbi:MAG TPA: hypothetical protein VIM11_02035, partial [Tepidisphaeraceae bacterium]